MLITDKWLEGAQNEPAGWRRRKKPRDTCTLKVLDAIEARHDKDLDRIVDQLFNHPYYSFEPRASNTARFDDQAGFIDSASTVTVCLGGNGSGKTYCGAMRAAQFLCEKQVAPKKDTPFWIIADTYEQSCTACWFQKLREIIPAHWIEWDRIVWYREKRQWPYSVPLKPWPSHPDRNWIIEFKSYEQGREAMQAAAIGGAWFTEQFPWAVFNEVLRGCREWMFPGSVWCEFTPIDPEKSQELSEVYERWLSGDAEYKSWSFHRLNTEVAKEAGHVNEEWFDTFFGSISEEMKETRMTGAFASYEGAIYQSFNPALHLADRLSFAMGV